MLMEGGNFHLIFTRRCLRTFCSTLCYHAIFAGTIEEALPRHSSRPTYLTSISKLRQKRSIGLDGARDIQSRYLSVRSSYSRDDRYS